MVCLWFDFRYLFYPFGNWLWRRFRSRLRYRLLYGLLVLIDFFWHGLFLSCLFSFCLLLACKSISESLECCVHCFTGILHFLACCFEVCAELLVNSLCSFT